MAQVYERETGRLVAHNIGERAGGSQGNGLGRGSCIIYIHTCIIIHVCLTCVTVFGQSAVVHIHTYMSVAQQL